MTEPEAQAALAEVALVLVAIADQLQTIHDALPTARNRDAMLEHRVPRDVATEVYGAIEAVLVDEIRPAIKYLEAASRVTADELRERFVEDERGAMTSDPMPEPEGPEDERFVYVVTAAGVEAVQAAALVVDSERETLDDADANLDEATRLGGYD